MRRTLIPLSLLVAGLVAVPAARAVAAPPDAKFMMDAAAAGMAEVELGQLASGKATRQDVKDFAKMMVDDHTKANGELTGLAAKKNVTLPTAPGPQHKAAKARLEKLSGVAFDKAYMAEMVKDHEKAVRLFKQESTGGADADAKAWAAQTLPHLETHLSKAREVSGTPTASARH